MILVVAEKPSVGASISHVLGAGQRGTGYNSGNGYVVTWCVGHLVTLAMPGDIDPEWEKWRLDTLPMLPNQFPLEIIKNSQKQFAIVKKLLGDSRIDTVVCATDAGREGQLIFMRVYIAAGCKKPVRRLWISSMTDEAIRDGFRSLKDNAAYHNMYLSAKCRSEADWLVGLNATRLYSVTYNDKLTLGRVQTPTLAMLVQRQKEIDHFVSVPFYEVEADCGDFRATWHGPDGSRIMNRPVAEAIVQKCSGKPGIVTALSAQKKSVERPRLYDLNELQRDANRLFGYTAMQTLNIAQSLYETQKLTTYPRTDSRYLTTDMKAELPKLLSDIQTGYVAAAAAVDTVLLKGINADKNVIDDGKVTDHHAIIVTSNIRGYANKKLSKEEDNVLRLIVARLLCALGQRMEYEQTDLELTVEQEKFLATGKKLLYLGWREIEIALLGKPAGGGTENIFSVRQGDSVLPKQIQVLDKKTTPPKPYTEATLLTAMENAGRQITNAALKASMKSIGLGTTATRAGIIENLIKTGYVERSKKNLNPTDKGKALIAIVPRQMILPDLTAEWEEKLEDINTGKGDPDAFMDGIRRYVGEIVRNAPKPSAAAGAGSAGASGAGVVGTGVAGNPGALGASGRPSFGRCPRCGAPVFEGPKSYYCSAYQTGCKFALWKENRYFASIGKKLTAAMVKNFLAGKRVLLKGIKKKSGSGTYDAYLVFTDDGAQSHFQMEFPQRAPTK